MKQSREGSRGDAQLRGTLTSHLTAAAELVPHFTPSGAAGNVRRFVPSL